jgi:hypothetical protein
MTRAIADFAFASQGFTHGSRPLAWLTPDELKIDLEDPAQRRFGDYELLERIGQGGMGVVYRARQHGLDRDVAVKLLAAGPWASDEFVARFRREARNAARMQHPNIVEIYEFGHRDGLNYFSMRLVEGPSLAQRIAAKGPLPELEAAKCARLLAEAMDYAHRLDVLHLDLKPANVLVGHNGEPLIADFGLARRIDAGPGGGNEEISGTPSYMAPEQAVQASHPLSASTDIYGLGAILYEMLTARPPFRGNDPQETLASVVSRAPESPGSLRPGLSKDLEAICLRCLEKQPQDRYANARELADDLQRFMDGHVVRARPLDTMQRLGRWMRREPQLAAAVGVALLALALGGAGTAVAWQKAKRAQADAEYLGLATVLPNARNTTIYALSRTIRERLSDDALRVRFKELAASKDPHDWISAGMIGFSAFEENDQSNEQFRRALKALPNDRFALIASIRHCYGECAVPDAPERLARLEPNNLFAWITQIARPGYDQDRDGRLIWQYEHEPAVRARLRGLIAKAAQATTWDDGTSEIFAAKVKAYGVNYFPMPRQVFVGYFQRETDAADSMRSNLSWTFEHAWWVNGTSSGVLQRLCNPEASIVDDSLRADCARIFQLQVRNENIWMSIGGWRGLDRLGLGAETKQQVQDRWMQKQWLDEQRVWARERRPVERSRDYTADLMAYGRWEADLRQADRVKVPRVPPKDWLPLNPLPGLEQ